MQIQLVESKNVAKTYKKKSAGGVLSLHVVLENGCCLRDFPLSSLALKRRHSASYLPSQ